MGHTAVVIRTLRVVVEATAFTAAVVERVVADAVVAAVAVLFVHGR